MAHDHLPLRHQHHPPSRFPNLQGQTPHCRLQLHNNILSAFRETSHPFFRYPQSTLSYLKIVHQSHQSIVLWNQWAHSNANRVLASWPIVCTSQEHALNFPLNLWCICHAIDALFLPFSCKDTVLHYPDHHTSVVKPTSIDHELTSTMPQLYSTMYSPGMLQSDMCILWVV